jgi:hypothetical protein
VPEEKKRERGGGEVIPRDNVFSPPFPDRTCPITFDRQLKGQEERRGRDRWGGREGEREGGRREGGREGGRERESAYCPTRRDSQP